MRTIAGVPVDTLKEAGLSDADIAYILESSAKYMNEWTSKTAQLPVPDETRLAIVDNGTQFL